MNKHLCAYEINFDLLHKITLLLSLTDGCRNIEQYHLISIRYFMILAQNTLLIYIALDEYTQSSDAH